MLKVCIDSGYLSRENCALIEKMGAMPRILPKTGVSMKARGSGAWKRMMLEFVEDTQRWLREYHSRSIVETVNSTMKRLFGPLMKRLVERKATEILARILVYNVRQLIYLKYTNKGNRRREPEQAESSDLDGLDESVGFCPKALV